MAEGQVKLLVEACFTTKCYHNARWSVDARAWITGLYKYREILEYAPPYPPPPFPVINELRFIPLAWYTFAHYTSGWSIWKLIQKNREITISPTKRQGRGCLLYFFCVDNHKQSITIKTLRTNLFAFSRSSGSFLRKNTRKSCSVNTLGSILLTLKRNC